MSACSAAEPLFELRRTPDAREARCLRDAVLGEDAAALAARFCWRMLILGDAGRPA